MQEKSDPRVPSHLAAEANSLTHTGLKEQIEGKESMEEGENQKSHLFLLLDDHFVRVEITKSTGQTYVEQTLRSLADTVAQTHPSVWAKWTQSAE